MPPTGSLNLPLHAVAANASVEATGTNDDERIWTQILTEVNANATNSTPQGNILVLGDRQSGKSWLLGRLEKRDMSRSDAALEYHFLNVNTDYRDASYAYQLATAGAGVAPGESVTVPVWVLDGDEAFASLIKFALTGHLSRTVIVLCASLQEPANILPSLKKWTKIVESQIQNLFDRVAITDARRAQELFWQEYVEPLDSSMQSDKIPSMETEHVLLPLDQNILTHNIGAAVIVIMTKSDLAHSELSDDQMDRIQFHVRKFCMEHGAALIYTSAKEEKNTALLLKYLSHRVCGMPFTTPAQVVNKDSIFVPAGWDNEKKIDILKEAIPDIDQNLKFSSEKQPIKDHLIIEAEEEQLFLQKLASVEIAVPKRNTSQKQNGENADGNSPLVSFFNNLLKTKDNQVSQVSRGIVDPQAQLQRMLEQVNSSSNQSPSPDSSSQINA